MQIKNNRPRRIYIAGRLMKEMFDYVNFGEGAQRAKNYRLINGAPSPYVFLNRYGDPWSEIGLCNAYGKMCKSEGAPAVLDFKVTAHMLRHTFATFELYAESQNRNLGFALAWVRDRLGHASVQTTTMYVHCLDLLGEPYLNQYQREIDALLRNEVTYEAQGLPTPTGSGLH
jgi:integrase